MPRGCALDGAVLALECEGGGKKGEMPLKEDGTKSQDSCRVAWARSPLCTIGEKIWIGDWLELQ